MYENNPQIMSKLKKAMIGSRRRISVEECVRVIDYVANRIYVLLRRRGIHIEHIRKRQSFKNCVKFKLEILCKG